MVVGGEQRHDSVRAGLAAVGDERDLVAIHDAARPLVPAAVIGATVAALDDEDVVAAAPALPVADTLKRESDGMVHTIDRTGIQAVQTPQVFRTSVLRGLLADADASVTDELLIIEAALADGRVSGRIVLVPGSLRAMKVTRLEDLDVVRDLARNMSSSGRLADLAGGAE
jgi:2-C-methyl-D-erythritol 4-phosphate cytidylyltransferase